MIEMGTFVAILLGNLAGGLLIALPAGGWLTGAQAVAVASLVLAVLGRAVSQCGAGHAGHRARTCASTGTRSPRPGAT